MCISYLHTKFHIPGSSGILVIAVKLEVTWKFCTDTMWIYILQKYFLNKSCMFFEYLWSYIISRLYIKWHWCNSRLTGSCIYHVDITDYNRKLKLQFWGGLQWHNFHTKFCENHSTCSKAEMDTHTGSTVVS